MDHSDTWKTPIHKDGWVMAHNSIRSELSEFHYVLKHLQNRNLTQLHIHHLHKWWRGHSEHIHCHHSNEDDKLNPFIRTKVEYPEKLEKDHAYLISCMKEINDCIMTLPIMLSKLLLLWDNYMQHMFSHLLEEEQVGIPLVRKHFTHNEFSVFLNSMLKDIKPIEMGSFIYYNGGKPYMKKMMRDEGIPWFVWYIKFRKFLSVYKKEVLSSLNYLKYN